MIEIPHIPGFEDLQPLSDKPQVRVFRARQGTESYSLRIINPDLVSDETYLSRVRGRTLLFQQIGDPNLAQVQWKEHPGTPPACLTVTKWYEFNSLRDLMPLTSDHPLALPMVYDVFSQAAMGLKKLHEAHLVHGNLKPSNLLLAPSGKGGLTVKLADIGAMLPFDLERMHPGLLELETYRYAMPKEYYTDRRKGSWEDIFYAPADIYALGMMLYEAVTGKYPFPGKEREDVTAAHLYDTPPPFNESLKIDTELSTLIQACLDKSPTKRPTASDLVTKLAARVKHDDASVPRPMLDRFSPKLVISGSRSKPETYFLSGYGLVIGGPTAAPNHDEENYIVQPGFAPAQVRIDWDGYEVLVTNQWQADTPAVYLHPLSLKQDGQANSPAPSSHRPASPLPLQGILLAPGAHTTWNWGDTLEVGDCFLRLEKPAELPPSPDTPPLTTHDRRVFSWSGQYGENPRLRIAVTPATLDVTPGQPAELHLTVENLTTVNEALRVRVEGQGVRADDWFAGLLELEPIHLNKGTAQRTIAVRVPPDPLHRAGAYVAVVRVRSEIDLAEQQQLVTLNVLPFARSLLEVRPRRRAAVFRADYVVRLHNQGNAATTYTFGAADEMQLLDYTFNQHQAQVEPGQAREVKLTVHPREWLWLGPRETRPFTARAAAPTFGEPQATPAILVQRPIIPRWLIWLIVLALGLIFLNGYFHRANWLANASLMGYPFYGILNPTPAPAPTASPTLTPTLDPALIAAFVIAPPSPTSTMTPTLSLTPTLTPTPTLTLPPTLAPISTAEPTPWPTDPVTGVRLCPAREDPPLDLTGRAEPGTLIELWFDGRRVDLGHGNDLARFTADISGTFRIPIVIGTNESGDADGFPLHTIVVRSIEGAPLPTDQFPQFLCYLRGARLPEPSATPQPSPTQQTTTVAPQDVTPGSTPDATSTVQLESTATVAPLPESVTPGSETATPPPAATADPAQDLTAAPQPEGAESTPSPEGTST